MEVVRVKMQVKAVKLVVVWVGVVFGESFGETFASSSSSPRGGEIKGLFSGPLLPSFL